MFVYNLVVFLYGIVIRLASLNNKKAVQWVNGRKNWRNELRSKLSLIGSGNKIWVHCASYGEFEQGRPLIEAIKIKHPECKIILTFFSPSGYEAFKNWKGADLIMYLPLDTPSNASDFVSILKPHSVIFVKYEFWLNYLNLLFEQKIPTYLVSAVFKDHHPFFKWYGSIFRRSLRTFNRLFIQDEHSAQLLKGIGITNFEVSGDTRFDRVMEIKHSHLPLPFFESFCSDNKVIIAGSTWPKDERFLIEVYKDLKEKNIKLIIAPHEVNTNSVSVLSDFLTQNGISFFKYTGGVVHRDRNVMIVDTIGLLSKIYFYSDVAYIGGGFDDGIHNCLEPAVFLKPVIFYGKGYEKFNEAVDLIKMKAATSVDSQEELKMALERYLFSLDKLVIEESMRNYFEKNSGTTKKIIDLLNFS